MKNDKINLRVLAHLHSKYIRQISHLSARQTAAVKKHIKYRKQNKS